MIYLVDGADVIDHLYGGSGGGDGRAGVRTEARLLHINSQLGGICPQQTVGNVW